MNQFKVALKHFASEFTKFRSHYLTHFENRDRLSGALQTPFLIIFHSQFNKMNDGEFDHWNTRNSGRLCKPNECLTSEWNLNGANYEINFDGYMRDGLIIRNFAQANFTPAGGLENGKFYWISLMAKAVSDINFTGSEVINVKNSNGEVVASGSLPGYNRFVKIAPTTIFIAGTSDADNELSIVADNYVGDLMIDHVLVVKASDALACSKTITFDLTGNCFIPNIYLILFNRYFSINRVYFISYINSILYSE